MSEFKCEVVRVSVEPHPNGDSIELARVGDYLSVVKKGQFQTGDLVVYIPEQAILPEWLLKEMGFWDNLNEKGKLHGSAGNRVRAMRLRGVVSQGLVYHTSPMSETEVMVDSMPHEGNSGMGIVAIGGDAADCMGITKYEPPMPSHMQGRQLSVRLGESLAVTHGYDFENLKKTPTLFDDGEEVVITEKIHGTLMSVSVVPAELANEKFYKGRVVLTSKGMGARGFILDHDDETNIYAQTAKKYGLTRCLRFLARLQTTAKSQSSCLVRCLDTQRVALAFKT